VKDLERLDARRGQNISRRVRFDPPTVWSWAALIAGALIGLWVTRSTQFHQLALGILLASITLLVLLSAFELLWQVLEVVVGSDEAAAADESERRR
jgi:uncharacterized membrane protein